MLLGQSNMLPSSAIDASSTIVDTTLNAGGRQQQGVSGVTQQAETGNRWVFGREYSE